jgi:glycosyltransferase involved in cell wall biosynthesis
MVYGEMEAAKAAARPENARAATQVVPRKKLSIIIPAYNEESSIEEIVRRVREVDIGGLDREIIIVDDGSKDQTRDILRAMQGIRAIFHEKNLGKGGALRTGVENATGDIVIFQDADLEYDPADYMPMIAPILDGRTEFVMGSRFLKEKPRFFFGRKSPFFTHYIGNQMIIRYTNLLYGFRATDYEGCYKAISRRLLLSLDVRSAGFDYDNELICKALRRKHPILEVPISYHPRTYEQGKKINWKHGVKILWTITKWRVRPF